MDNFFARLYVNEFKQQSIIAYRGTLPNRGDTVADIQIAISHFSSQDQQTKDYFEWAKGYLYENVGQAGSKFPAVTGHSLGGYLASLIGAENPDVLAVTFNAPGIGGLYDPEYGYIDPKKKYPNIHNYNIGNDPIHRIGRQIGNVTKLRGHSYCSPIVTVLGGAVYTLYCGYHEHRVETVREFIGKFAFVEY